MGQYRIADLNVEISTNSSTLLSNLKPYETSFDYKANLTLSISDDILLQYMEDYEGYTADIIEGVYIATEFCRGLFDFNGFPMFSSAVENEGSCVLFSSPFEEEPLQLPRDKTFCIDYPAIRLISDVFYAYDTPFGDNGDKSKRNKLPIKSIVFVDKSRFDSLRPIDTKDLVSMFIRAVNLSIKGDRTKHTLFMLEKVLKTVKFYGVSDVSDIDFILERLSEE